MRYSRPYFELTSRIAAAMKLTHLMKAAERMRREYKQLGLRFAGGLLVVIGAVRVAPRALAQQSALPRVGGEATRGDLQGYLAECERLASTSSISVEARQSYRRNAEVVRERLSDGDFRVGDLIVLTVQGFDSLSNTFTVRDGELLSLPGIPDIPLHGVLRSEIRSYLTEQLSRYLRHPEVRATTMLRLAVLGEVGKPGYYKVATDAPLSEALMAAGGPTSGSDLGRAVVRRSGQELLSRGDLRDALASGATPDQLNLRAGDELVVAAKAGTNWQALLQTTALLASAFVALRAAHIRF